jgi:hypothetical protein
MVSCQHVYSTVYLTVVELLLYDVETDIKTIFLLSRDTAVKKVMFLAVILHWTVPFYSFIIKRPFQYHHVEVDCFIEYPRRYFEKLFIPRQSNLTDFITQKVVQS